MKLPSHEDRICFEQQHGIFIGEINGATALLRRGWILSGDEADRALSLLLKVEAKDDLNRRVIGFLVARKLRGEK